MTTSSQPDEAYVWTWLPGATVPVVAGRLTQVAEITYFTYGRSYLDRPDAVALYLPELPLQRGRQRPLDGLPIAGCINDAGPDAWGQRVILAHVQGQIRADSDTADLSPITYLLESGSDRTGALDFQASAAEFVARVDSATLEEMASAAQRLEAGEPFSPALDMALLHGSSIGGARPKVLLDDGNRRLIAKLSSRSDRYPVVKAEAVAMELARRAGLQAASTEIIECLGHDVLLVERFDRTEVPGERRQFVSALTMLGLDEMMARYCTYPDLADIIRARFDEPARTLHEVFARITFNICVGNTDDHARNHAAFWDGSTLKLTPAYDICPQPRSGTEASQAMAIGRDGFRASQLRGCVDAAPIYALTPREAREIIDRQLDVIHTEWDTAADAAQLTAVERQRLWGRQILNAYATEGY